MKYWLDTEFVENGKTIDLLSIGIVSEDNRRLYLQNIECKFSKASDWVWRNVFPHLQHFCMALGGDRNCNPMSRLGGMGDKQTHCSDASCPWRSHSEIRNEVKEFVLAEHSITGGMIKPEIWGYYCDYDWVAVAQLFGRMIDLPKGMPMYCRDLKQWADQLGNPELPKKVGIEHDALCDALWNRQAYEFLERIARDRDAQLTGTAP